MEPNREAPAGAGTVSKTYDVVVVGAGITGAATAYHLRKEAGCDVLLVDRHGPAAGGTGKSAAIVRQHYSTPLAVRLAKQSIAMFAAMPDELGASGGFVQCGYRMLVPPDLLDGARTNIAMQQAQGVVTELIDGAKGTAALGWLNPDGVAAIVYEPHGGHADPVRATEAYVEAFRRSGGEVAFKTPARSLLGDAHKVTGILTDDGPIAAGAVVNAAGPWAAPLAAGVGLELPLRSVREQDTVWEARGDRPLPDTPISNAVDAIYLRPLGDRRYVIGRGFPKPYEDVDPYNYKETADEAFVAEIMETDGAPLSAAARRSSHRCLCRPLRRDARLVSLRRRPRRRRRLLRRLRRQRPRLQAGPGDRGRAGPVGRHGRGRRRFPSTRLRPYRRRQPVRPGLRRQPGLMKWR